MADMVSNPLNVSNHQPKPYFGDEYFAMQDTVHKITKEWCEYLYHEEMTDQEIYYMYIGYNGWLKTFGSFIADTIKMRRKIKEGLKVEPIASPHGYIR